MYFGSVWRNEEHPSPVESEKLRQMNKIEIRKLHFVGMKYTACAGRPPGKQ